MFSHRIESGLELSLLEPRHAAAVFALTDANRDHLRPWMPWVDGTRSVADTEAFIKHSLGRFAAGQGVYAGIFSGGRLIGTIGLDVDLQNLAGEIGYWVGRAAQGSGAVTKSSSAMTDHAFHTLGLRRVVIRCATENLRSRAVPERLGFTVEGTLRQSERLGAAFHDMVQYAMLAEDWKG